MPQDTSTFQYNFWGTNVPLQCVLEAGHYSEPGSYHHAFFPTNDYIVVWDDNGDRIEWDDGVGSIGSAFEVSIDTSFIPDIADIWTSVPSLGDLDNLGELAISLNAFYVAFGQLYDRVTALETPEEWHYFGDTGEPALQNSFTTLGSGYNRAGFRKVSPSDIEISGLFMGAANTTIFTLPEGYRPDRQNKVAGAICIDLSTGNNMFDGFTINTDGTVVSGGNPSGFSVPGWSALTGIRYPLHPPEVAP